jgi:Tfp pilus assembly protein PilZ
MDHHRKEPRKKLMAFTPVYNFANKSLLGYISNITLEGMMVVTEHPVEAGQEITLDIELPSDLPIETDPQFLIQARIAWCKPDDDLKSYTIGFQFINTTPKQIEVIEAILERYHFRYSPSSP